MAAPLESPLLPHGAVLSPDATPGRRARRPCAALAIAVALLALAGVLLLLLSTPGADPGRSRVSSGTRLSTHEVESAAGAVAADDGRCSEVGAAALRAGGHAVDAAVAAALCLGVVHPMSSGIGGGAFIVVRDAGSGEAVAFDARETAPAAATPVRLQPIMRGNNRKNHLFFFSFRSFVMLVAMTCGVLDGDVSG
jgi:hypothetical protein